VVAQAMPVCKGDGSSADGDVTGISSLGTTTDAWNANSCNLSITPTATQQADAVALQNDIISYIKNPSASRIE
jgi:hypothetical protein